LEADLQINAISTLLFDLDGTLRFNSPPSSHFFLDYAASKGIPDSTHKRREAIRWTHRYWAQSPELINDLETYPDENTFWCNFSIKYLLAFGCPEELAETLGPEINRYMFAEHKPVGEIPPVVHDILTLFKEEGFQLGLVSNRTNPVQEEINELGIGKYFDYTVVAGEISSWKPDPLIFLHALDELRAEPDRTVYVGDNFYADVVGARAAGLQPVLFDEEGIFPDADCPVITSLTELPVWIAERSNSYEYVKRTQKE